MTESRFGRNLAPVPDVDVAIVGAGPAGCATALSLSDFAPELSVLLLGPPPLVSDRIGETVAPPIEPILVHLGLWGGFEADGHRRSYRTLSAWGSARLAANEFLFHTHQVGWRLDRARFDATVLAAAEPRGVSRRAGKFARLERRDDGLRIAVDDGSAVSARFVVDATGRAAALARSQRLSVHGGDAMIGCSVHVEDRCPELGDLLVESFAEGWWYTAGLPGGRRVVACMTDSDRARELGLRSPTGFMGRVAETEYVGPVAADAPVLSGPKLWAAGSRQVVHAPTLPLLCVGDAACCFDPISGQGIVKALRSGIFASYAIADFLRDGDDRGLRRYRSLQERDFAAYRAVLRDFYALERRWAERPFWRRRHAAPLDGDVVAETPLPEAPQRAPAPVH